MIMQHTSETKPLAAERLQDPRYIGIHRNMPVFLASARRYSIGPDRGDCAATAAAFMRCDHVTMPLGSV